MLLNITRRPAGADCASILAELPEWFGMPQSNAAYAASAEHDPTWVAHSDTDVLGVMIVLDTGYSALDIHLLAVRRHVHRQGVGRALLRQARAVAWEAGKAYLTVKTQGPSADQQQYARTRAFYDGVGFLALEEFNEIWGPENPCLVMIRPVAE